MIRQEHMTIAAIEPLAERIYKVTLEGDLVEEMTQPGQFVHIRIGSGIDPLLRRPISIARIDRPARQAVVIFRAEGKGTGLLSTYRPGDVLDVLGPLGNGFPVDSISPGEVALLVGGGIGVPPLYELSRQLKAKGVIPVHVLGFETASVAFYEKEFAKLGETYVSTVDGSLGAKGFVTDAIEEIGIEFNRLYSCGPIPMLKALEERFHNKEGYMSLEQRMGCGIGACLACVCHTAGDDTGTAYRKICTDGPVFKFGEVVV